MSQVVFFARFFFGFGVNGVGGVFSIARSSFFVRRSASDFEYRSSDLISSAVVRFAAGSLFIVLPLGYTLRSLRRG